MSHIPKILHYCWFGGRPIPEKTQTYINTWQEKCPDYTLMRWDEHNFDVDTYRYTREAYDAKKWAFVSDVCRLDKVYEYGGIYLDVNTAVLQSFDPLLDQEMFAGFEQDNHIQMGVFGAKKHHPLLKKILDTHYSSETLLDDTGTLNLRTINSRVQQELVSIGMRPDNSYQELSAVTVYPKEYFCPRYWNSPKEDPTTANTYTIHYFGATWHDAYMQQKLAYARQDILVSVIVPVYKVEKYLAACLDSILQQTYSNIEVIVVDDESPDTSGVIADRYSQHDGRVKVVHKPKNEGLNMARATGFAHSSGEYITFIDSDDMIAESCIETILRELVESKTSDFVRFDMLLFEDDSDLTHKLALEPLAVTQKTVLTTKKELFETNITKGKITVCGAIYSRVLVAKIDWEETNYRAYEDNIWSLRLIEHSTGGTYLSYAGYLYRSAELNTGVLSKSTVHNSFNGKPVGYLEFIALLLAEYEAFNEKYKLGSEAAIQFVANWHWNDRARKVAAIDKWTPEDADIPYVVDLVKWCISEQDRLIAENTTHTTSLEQLSSEVTQKDEVIASRESIKGSGRLLARSVGRRIKRIKPRGR